MAIKAKLADFGISQEPIQKTAENTYQVRGGSGTQAYMAPEQFLKAPYDPFKADIYALGMMLFHMTFK